MVNKEGRKRVFGGLLQIEKMRLVATETSVKWYTISSVGPACWARTLTVKRDCFLAIKIGNSLFSIMIGQVYLTCV